jgi:DNA-binding CsgD family transcriptional regulator
MTKQTNERDIRQTQSRAAGWLSRLPHFSLFFLGLGVYRAWIETVFVGSFIEFPLSDLPAQDIFDLTMTGTLFIGALTARRIKSLLPRRGAYLASGGLLILSTALMYLSLLLPGLAGFLILPAALLGGLGIALLILMWSEIYSCLNPLRVTMYYSASLATAALIIYLCRGMLLPLVATVSFVLPPLSLLCVLLSYRSLPLSDTPIVPDSWFSFPWKPVMLMAVYGLAFGLKETGLYSSGFGPHSSFGTITVALLIFVAVMTQGRHFDLTVIYRIGLPLMVGAFLLLPAFGFFNEVISDFCVSASYAAFSILTMIILASMSYHYGISALWLFGIERGIRALFVYFGREISAHSDLLAFTGINPELLMFALTVLLVVTLSVILFSEKDISSRWGVMFRGKGDSDADEAILRKQELATLCNSLAKRYHLTQREEEVLLLLAQEKSISTIERDLFIANGTAKAHVRHIYKKLEIHSRDELFALLRR